MDSDITFYWTGGSGAANKALRIAALDEHPQHYFLRDHPLSPEDLPDITHGMISYATKENTPWEGVPHGTKLGKRYSYQGTTDIDWTVDCGGYQLLSSKSAYDFSIADFVDFIATHDDYIDRVALRDWACEPDLTARDGRSVALHQAWTLEDHIEMVDTLADRGVTAQPMAVIQGHRPGEYQRHIQQLRDYGLIYDDVGIGSVCGRDRVEEIAAIISTVDTATPQRCDLHGFGVKVTALGHPDVRAALASADSGAWDGRLSTDAGKPVHNGPRVRDRWIDYNSPTDPSEGWRNQLLALAGYHQRLTATLDDDADDTAGYTASLPSASGSTDELECVCGNVVDPGAPTDERDLTCRHCERLMVRALDRQQASRAEFTAPRPQPQPEDNPRQANANTSHEQATLANI